MPSALLNNALHPPRTITTDKPREMDEAHKRDVAVNVASIKNGDAIASEKGKGKANKRSFDYIWRTGVAGGLAGCAVC